MRCNKKRNWTVLITFLAQCQLASHLLTMKHNFLALLCCNFINVSHSIFVFRILCNIVLVAFVIILLLCVMFVCTVGCAVDCYETVSSSRMEQQINLKFLVKLRKTTTECFKLLKEVYGEDVMLRTQIFEWYKHFEKGCKELEDDLKKGQPPTTRTDENITRVKQLVQSDHRLTVQMISDELSLNRESMQTILLHDLGMQKVYAKMVPEILL